MELKDWSDGRTDLATDQADLELVGHGRVFYCSVELCKLPDDPIFHV